MQVRRESYIGFDTDEGGKKEGHVKECMGEGEREAFTRVMEHYLMSRRYREKGFSQIEIGSTQ